MNFLAAFIATFLTSLLSGLAFDWIARHFASARTAALAAFWVTVGNAAGRYGGAAKADADLLLVLGGLTGAALALFILWRTLLRGRPEATD